MLFHHKVTPSILSGFPDNSPVPIYTPGLREAWWESIIFPKNTTHWPDQVLYPDLLIRSSVHWVSGQCISQGWEVRLLHAMETTKSCGCIAYLAWIKTLPFSLLLHIFFYSEDEHITSIAEFKVQKISPRHHVSFQW